MTSAHTSTRKRNSDTSLQTPRTALIAAGAVLCFGMLSFFVYGVQAPSAQKSPQSASASPR